MKPTLLADLDRALAMARDYEDALVRLRRWVAGRKFQAGVHVLESVSDGEAAGHFLAAIADATILRLLPLVEAEFTVKHGRIAGGLFAVVAFGRLGGRVMSFSSDLDLVTIYDAPEGSISDGESAARARALLHPPDPAADRGDHRADGRGPALRCRSAPAPLG